MAWRRDILGVWDCCCSVPQSSPALCDPMDCSLPGFSVHGDSPGKDTGVGCHALFQGIFPTQGSNPGLLHYRWIPYCLGHQGSPRILEWVAYPFSRGSSWLMNQTGVYCMAGRFFTSWATREAPLSPCLLKLMFIESVMPSTYLILFCSLLL